MLTSLWLSFMKRGTLTSHPGPLFKERVNTHLTPPSPQGEGDQTFQRFRIGEVRKIMKNGYRSML